VLSLWNGTEEQNEYRELLLGSEAGIALKVKWLANGTLCERGSKQGSIL
jgi:hypothetical protein